MYTHSKSMLAIRPEQMAALESNVQMRRHARICHEIANYLRENYPLAVRHFADKELRDEVSASVRRAAAYGFLWQTSILAFVSLRFDWSIF